MPSQLTFEAQTPTEGDAVELCNPKGLPVFSGRIVRVDFNVSRSSPATHILVAFGNTRRTFIRGAGRHQWVW